MLENISQYRKEGKRAADNLKDPLRRKCFGRHVKARPAAAAQGARVSVFQLERVEMSELAHRSIGFHHFTSPGPETDFHDDSEFRIFAEIR